MADTIGLQTIADRIAHYATTRGDSYGYWKPTGLLEKQATTAL